MNKTVTATGMKVEARAEGGIVIARSAVPGTKATSVSSAMGDSATALLPTSTKTAGTWYHAEAQTDSASTAIQSTYQTLTLTDTTPTTSALGTKNVNSNTYVLYDNYTITPDQNSSAFTDLWVSACTVAIADDVSNVADLLSKSLRVAIVCGGNVVICAPLYDTTQSYNIWNGTSGEGSATNVAVKALGTSGTGSSLLTLETSGDAQNALASGSQTSTTVSVYIFFEGEDSNHTTTNLGLKNDKLTITVKFSCTSVSAST